MNIVLHWLSDAAKKDKVLPELPDDGRDADFGYEEFEECVLNMKNGKAPGPDDIPVEHFKTSPAACRLLYNICKKVWVGEKMPVNFVLGHMCMVHKKGNPDDMWNYRPICLLSHAYKCLSTLILRRMRPFTEAYLPDLQDGFRAGRGCRNATTITHALVERCVIEGRRVIAVFVDYKDAFSSTSHVFLDEALGESGISSKIRRLIRLILSAAKCAVTMRGADGVSEHSPHFNIGRGVLQGDIFSPVCFIVGLQKLFKDCNEVSGGKFSAGAKVCAAGTVRIPYQKYADDAALYTEVSICTDGPDECPERITLREELGLAGEKPQPARIYPWE